MSWNHKAKVSNREFSGLDLPRMNLAKEVNVDLENDSCIHRGRAALDIRL
jgi:hypothetical protein